MDTAKKEGLKEIGRWIVLYGVSSVFSWIITSTLGQVVNVPENINFSVWVFTYAIPLRAALSTALTLVGRFIDKYLYELAKQAGNVATKFKGLVGF
jgi:hypothetical protein